MNAYNKEPFVENNVVLVYVDNQPAFFARVEFITADIKKEWWQITFLLLNIPLTTFTWILDNEQIRGADFTMQGTSIRIEKVVSPSPGKHQSLEPENPVGSNSEKGRILSMRKKDS